MKKINNRKGYNVHLSNSTINRLKFIKAVSKNNFDIGLFIEKCLKENIDEVESKLKINNSTWKNAIKCANCKSYMILKKGSKGKFYGCLNYPNCKNTRSLENAG